MRVVLVSVALAFVALPILAHERRAALAFHYATPLTAAELERYAKFETLVTHDPLPRAQVEALHKRGTKLVLYEWAVAFYATRATAWQRSLLGTRALLNATPLRGHLGANDADAWYYDPASPDHARDRAAAIERTVKAIGYDGMFLDVTTAESVHPEALAEYRRRHRDVSYDAAFADFLRALDRRGLVIITNQGYRAASHVLRYVDRDVSESLITMPRNGRFVFRPWNDPSDPWNSIDFLMRKLIPRGAKITHINYLDMPDARRIETIDAVARLYGGQSFVSVPALDRGVECTCYFADLGRAEARVVRAGGAFRRFARGLVAVNASHRPMTIANRGGVRYEDVVTGERYGGKTIVIPAAGEDGLRGVVLQRIGE